MRRFRLIPLTVFLFAAYAFCTTPVPVPVTGNVSSITGGAVPYAVADIQLQNCASPIAITGYSVIVQQEYQLQANASGVINSTVWSNDIINCNGTTGNSQYMLSWLVNGAVQGTPQCYQVVQTQTWNLLTQQPITCSQSPPNPQDGSFHNLTVSNCFSVQGSPCGTPFTSAGGPIGSSIYIADGAAPCSPLNPTFGAKFDGVTDDTAADQAFINYVASHNCAMQWPAGTTLISAPLNIPFTQSLRFWGMCRGACTTFKMATDNTPVFVFNHPNTHSLDFGYFGVTWANQQGTGNTNAIAFQFTTLTGDASGFYRNHFHDLNIDRSNRTFAVTSTAGQETFWGNTIENVTATNVTGSFYWAAPTASIGMPINRINGNTIFGYSPASVNTEANPAIYEVAGEYEINGNIIQNWNQEVLYGQGGGHVSFRDNHIENQSLASSSGRVFYMANGSWIIQNNSIAMVPGQTGLFGAQVFGTNGSLVTWDSNRLDAPAAGSIGTWYLTNNSGSTIQGNNNLDTFTSLTPMLSASVAEWIPGSQFATALKQNQSTPQLVELSGTTANTSAYQFDSGPAYYAPGKVYYYGTGSGTWGADWFYIDNSGVWHFQKCTGVTGATPPLTLPSGCSDLFTVSNTGAISNANAVVIPAAATGVHGSTGVKVQMSDGTGTSSSASFDSNGNLTSGGTSVWYIAATACTPATSTDAQCTATQTVAQPDTAYGAVITMLSSAGAGLAATVTGKTTTTLTYAVTCIFNCGSYGTLTADIHVHHN